MTPRSFGFAIVGCGVIGPFHARAIADLPEARLVAVVDGVEDRARRLGAEFGAQHFTNLDAMLSRADVDVVSVCVPSGMHAEIGVRAAAAGKHVIVEKPIDIALAAADRLIAACRDNRVKLTSISQHRYDAGIRQLRDLIDAGRLGRLILGDAVIKWYRTQQYYNSGSWRGTWALDGGGCLMNQGIHYVDLLQWMMGPVESVFARSATADHAIEVEDVVAAVLRFASGAIGVLEASTAVFPGLPERLEVTGTGGTVVVEGGQVKVCELRDERGEAPAHAALVSQYVAEKQASADPTAIGYQAHREQIGAFLDAIANDREPELSGQEARKSLEIVLAVYESAKTGREVSLPLATIPA